MSFHWMRCVIAVPLILLLSPAATLQALTIVAPNANATAEGNSSNVFPFAVPNGNTMRQQQVYAASEFSIVANQTITITEIALRRDGSNAGINSSFFNIQFNLSTTSKAPDGLSTTFALNVGADDKIVRSGNIPVVSSTNTSPRPFEIVIALTSPFTYTPANGNLLLDIRNFNTNGSFNTGFDGVLTTSDSVSRVFSSMDDFAGVNATTGLANTYGYVTSFTYTVPEPAAAGMLVSLAGLIRRRRSHT